MKKYIVKSFILLLIILTSTFTFAQEETEQKEEKPVRSPFEASTLIESQTVIGSSAKQLELIIHHRFGSVENGITDLFGIYAPSNIRMGLQYGISDKLTIGIGTEKDNKFQDLNAKYAVFQQTRSGSMPVSLSVHGNITIEGKIQNGQLLIRLEDTGPGIKEDVLAQVFDPFFTTKEKKGTGLGLSIVKTIVETHRGSIECHSELNKGTTFIVQLPLH